MAVHFRVFDKVDPGRLGNHFFGMKMLAKIIEQSLEQGLMEFVRLKALKFQILDAAKKAFMLGIDVRNAQNQQFRQHAVGSHIHFA
jgi:hypothetical protein